MPVKYAGKDLLAINYGPHRIAQIYYGPTLIYQCYFVKLTFYFDRTNANPRGKLGTRARQCGAEWISTSDPHVWHVITPLYTKGAGGNDDSLGIGKLFCADADTGLLMYNTVGSCQLTDISGDYLQIETLDRLFQGCTAVTSISKTGFYDKFTNSSKLNNVNGMCKDCTGITDGSSLNGYNVFDQIASITTHAGTFTNADTDANLAQIPTSWGGTMAPPATQFTVTLNNAAGWNVNISDPDCPDFTTVTALELFTTASISRYDGVNMRKTNIWNWKNGFATAGQPTFYYPCFFQGTNSWPTSKNSNYIPTWIFGPTGYNGTLNASTTAGDMPGTLDHERYGTLTTRYGTFDSAKSEYLGFLVLNNSAYITAFDPATTPFAIHSNTNFSASMPINWYIPE